MLRVPCCHHLEHATTTWDPHTKINSVKVEELSRDGPLDSVSTIKAELVVTLHARVSIGEAASQAPEERDPDDERKCQQPR